LDVVAVQCHNEVVIGISPSTLPTEEANRLVLRDPSDAAEERGQILAVHVLHGEEPPAAGLAEIVEAANVLVRHLSRRAELVVELREMRLVEGVGVDGAVAPIVRSSGRPGTAEFYWRTQ
jgi:hypothetical protein